MKRSNNIMIVLMIGLLTLNYCAEKYDNPSTRHNSDSDSTAYWKSSDKLEYADSLFNTDNFEKSWEEYEKHIRVFQQSGDTLNYIYCIIQESKILVFQGELDDAYHLLVKIKNIVDQKYKLHQIRGELYYNLGTIFLYKNNIDSSLFYNKKAIEIQKQVYKTPNEDLLRSYTGLGNVYRYLMFDYARASQEFEKALSLIDSLKSPNLTETHFRCLYNLATTYRSQNDFDKALYYGMECIKYSKQLADTEILKYSNSMMANIYSSRKEYDKAIDFYKQTLNIEESSKERDISFYVYCLNNLGITYLTKGENDSAIFFMKRILELDMSLVHDADHLKSEVLYNLGQSYNGKQKYDSAIYFLNKALVLFNKIYFDKHSEIAEVYHELGNSYRNIGKIDSSLVFYQKALINLSQKFNSPDILKNPDLSDLDLIKYTFPFIGKKAQALYSQYLNKNDIKYLINSLSTYLLADSVMSERRNKYLLENDELWLAKESKEYINGAIICAYDLFNLTRDQYYLNILFRFIEKNNARILLKTLSNIENLNVSGVPDSLINKQMYLTMRFVQLQNKLKNEQSETEKNTIQSHLYSIIRDQEKLEKHLEVSYPNYYRTRNIKDTLQLFHLREYAKESKSAILQYKYIENSLFIINTLSDTSIIIKTDSIKNLSNDIDNLHELLLNSNPFDFNQYNSFLTTAHSIYKQILEPVIKQIQLCGEDISTISIIPDGNLSLIPFECLISEIPELKNSTPDYKNLNYIVNQYSISYNYSANFLYHNTDYKNKILPYSILGFAYDKLNTYSPENKKYNFKKLTGTLEEMSIIRRYSDNRIFLEDSATETNFKKYAEKAQILHIGIHGIASNQEEKYSSELLFNKDFSDSTNDGNLHIYELYNMKLNARLAVLSACESGVGRLETGEGVYSMARGFFYAGCPSVIMSLWKINDQSNMQLMTRFYSEIEAGQKIDNALRNAKLTYLEISDEFTSHPSNWAPMVLLGKNNTLDIKKTSPNHLLYFFLITGVILFIIITRYFVRKFIKTS